MFSMLTIEVVVFVYLLSFAKLSNDSTFELNELCLLIFPPIDEGMVYVTIDSLLKYLFHNVVQWIVHHWIVHHWVIRAHVRLHSWIIFHHHWIRIIKVGHRIVFHHVHIATVIKIRIAWYLIVFHHHWVIKVSRLFKFHHVRWPTGIRLQIILIISNPMALVCLLKIVIVNGLLEATFQMSFDDAVMRTAAYLDFDLDHVDSSCRRLDSFRAHFSVHLIEIDSVAQPSTTVRIVMKVVTLRRETIVVNSLLAASAK